MDTVRHTDSVLAKLMGMDRLRSEQQAYGRKIDFLSKGYVQNFAPVDSGKRGYLDENETCMEIDGQMEENDVTEEPMTPGVVEHHNMPGPDLHRSSDERLSAMNGKFDCPPPDHPEFYREDFGYNLNKPHFSEDMFRRYVKESYSFSPRSQVVLQRKVVRETDVTSSLKLRNDSIEHHIEFDEKYLQKLLQSKLKITWDPSLLSSRKAHQAGRITSAFLYLSSNRKNKASSGAQHRQKCLKGRGSENMDCGITPCRDGYISHRGIAEKTISEVRNSVWHSYCRTGFEPGMKTSNEYQKSKPSKSMTIPHTTENITKRRFVLHKDWCLDIGENVKQLCSNSSDDKGSFEYSFHGNIKATPDSKIDHKVQDIPSASNERNNSEDTEEASGVLDSPNYFSACSDIEELADHDTSVSLDDREGELIKQDSYGEDLVAFESPSHTFPMFMDDVEEDNLQNNDHPFPISTRYQKRQKYEPKAHHDASLQEIKHDGLDRSPLWEGRPEHFFSSPEAHRHTFDSSSIRRLEIGNGIHGSKIHPLPLDMDLQGVDSEVPRMWDASVEEDKEGSAYCGPVNGGLIGTYSTQENREFSYLVDVLAKSGYLGKKGEMDYMLWLSLDYALEPCVFNTLEKKYGKQTCWDRSERRLLFDRINKALLEIIQSYTGAKTWKKSVAKICALPQHKEAIQDQVFTKLSSQEKEARKESSELVFENETEWLHFEEDIDLTAKEIEKYLVDDLVEEFVSVHSF